MKPIQYTAAIAANGTSTSGLDLGDTFRTVYGQIPSFSTNAAINVLGSIDGSNFYNVAGYEITSANNNAFNALPAGFRYLKFQVTGTVCAAADITVICSNQW